MVKDNYYFRTPVSNIISGPISESWKGVLRCLGAFNAFSSWEVGNGTKALFWSHDWTGGGSLQSTAPEVFEWSRNKSGVVRDFRSVEHSWWIRLQPGCPSGTRRQARSLSSALPSLQVIDNAPSDRLSWKITHPSHHFTVKSCYERLTDGEKMCSFTPTIFSLTSLPLKIRIFGWLAFKQRIPTKAFLARIGIPLVSSDCVLCGEVEEHIWHIFGSCTFLIQVWLKTKSLMGNLIPSTGPRIPRGIPKWGGDDNQPWTFGKMWTGTILMLLWTVWLERNRVIFYPGQSGITRKKIRF